MRTTVDIRRSATHYLDGLKTVIDKVDVDQVATVIDRLLRAYQRDGYIYIFGNGGSASTASHFVNDFNKGIDPHGTRRFRFCCLNDNVPTVLALANDVGYDQVFAGQLRNFLTNRDVVIGISGSGNSPNVLEAIRYAKSREVETIALVGYDGGRLRELVDYCIHVPVHDMQKVEDVHLAMNHLMMTALKELLEARTDDR
jgi:D-sedoheptulose 7-phosphate isomerase